MPQPDFLAAVRRALAARGWSWYRLAQESGVRENTLSAWNRGETDLTSSRLEALAAVLGLDLRARE